MKLHLLNGDALRERFDESGIDGDVCIHRECLIVGNVSGTTLSEFWSMRARFISSTFARDMSEYAQVVQTEFEKLLNAPSETEYFLWFGYDLFCQVNLWFALHLLRTRQHQSTVRIVYPTHLPEYRRWEDFGTATPEDLRYCLDHCVVVSPEDISLGDALWNHYKTQDLVQLAKLSQQPSNAFPFLQEVCQAHIDRFQFPNGHGRPHRIIQDIVDRGVRDFGAVFREFTAVAGVYGFGDVQVMEIYQDVLHGQR